MNFYYFHLKFVSVCIYPTLSDTQAENDIWSIFKRSAVGFEFIVSLQTLKNLICRSAENY